MVSTAISFAKSQIEPIIKVVDDTNIAFMLLYDLEKGMQDILLMQDRWKRAWSASYTTLFIQDIKSHLLLIHVFHDVIQHQLLLENERLT